MACHIALMQLPQYPIEVWTSDASEVRHGVLLLVQQPIYREVINGDTSKPYGFEFSSVYFPCLEELFDRYLPCRQ